MSIASRLAVFVSVTPESSRKGVFSPIYCFSHTGEFELLTYTKFFHTPVTEKTQTWYVTYIESISSNILRLMLEPDGGIGDKEGYLKASGIGCRNFVPCEMYPVFSSLFLP